MGVKCLNYRRRTLIPGRCVSRLASPGSSEHHVVPYLYFFWRMQQDYRVLFMQGAFRQVLEEFRWMSSRTCWDIGFVNGKVKI
jgi:hypothetical protein